MTSLHKRKDSGSYFISYRIDGRQYKKGLGKVKRANALNAFRKFQDELELRKLGLKAPTRISLEAFFDEYLTWSNNKQSPKTYAGKLNSLHNFCKYLVKKKGRNVLHTHMLTDITSSLVERYIQHRSKSNVCARTINIELDFISNLFRKAEEWGYVAPKFKIERLAETKKAPRYLSEDEISLILQNSSNHLRQVIMLGIHTGMRISEILNLEWSQVDFAHNLIYVSNTATFSTKNKTDRIIPMNTALRKYLFWLKDLYIRPAKDTIMPREPFQKKYVLCNEDGARIKRIEKSFRRFVARLGVHGATLHTLRHTFASHCVMNGVDLYMVKEFLGHGDIKTTEIYSHLNNKYRQKSIEKIASVTDLLPGGQFELLRTG